jgi:hypothetical protein
LATKKFIVSVFVTAPTTASATNVLITLQQFNVGLALIDVTLFAV